MEKRGKLSRGDVSPTSEVPPQTEAEYSVENDQAYANMICIQSYAKYVFFKNAEYIDVLMCGVETGGS